MKYLCLVYGEEKGLDALPKREFDEVLRQGGHYIYSNALQRVQASTTVRVRNGKVSVTDGPFAETKEQLNGYILIEARDLNEAIQVASKVPSIRLGCVEIRPVLELKYSSAQAARK